MARRARQERPLRHELPRPIDPANFDTTCAACANFFQFANGGWLKRTTIPAAYSRWGSFNELADRNEAVLRHVIEASATNTAAPVGSNDQKIGAYYRSCMDSVGIERAGLAPVPSLLQRVDALTRVDQMTREFDALEREAGLAPRRSRTRTRRAFTGSTGRAPTCPSSSGRGAARRAT